MFESAVGCLASGDLNRGARVVVEKQSGRDSEPARELNACLRGAFPEEAIYRIDHYLQVTTRVDAPCCRQRESY
jgi:glucose-6-phosphate 1-dehydrogenase